MVKIFLYDKLKGNQDGELLFDVIDNYYLDSGRLVSKDNKICKGRFDFKRAILDALGYTKERALQNKGSFSEEVQIKNFEIIFKIICTLQGYEYKQYNQVDIKNFISFYNEAYKKYAYSRYVEVNQFQVGQDVIQKLLGLKCLAQEGSCVKVSEYIYE